jgi:hypothetical protein
MSGILMLSALVFVKNYSYQKEKLGLNSELAWIKHLCHFNYSKFHDISLSQYFI